MNNEKKEQKLQQIASQVLKCRKCRLCEEALNAVPGEGNPDSDIVFVGEAPGANEDKEGRPFVGRAGKLLESLLGEIGYDRSEVWIGNIIKHRPPKNRDPLPDEIAACSPYLRLQLQTLKPKIIVTLGRFSMNYFYPEGKITNDHGKAKRLPNGVVIYPVYHPAAALRNSKFAQALRKDFLRIPKLLELIESGKTTTKPTNDMVNASDQGQEALLNF